MVLLLLNGCSIQLLSLFAFTQIPRPFHAAPHISCGIDAPLAAAFLSILRWMKCIDDPVMGETGALLFCRRNGLSF